MDRRSEPYREWSGVTDWLATQLAETGVKVELGHRVTADELADRFEAAVIATGSTPLRHGWTARHPDLWAGGSLPGSDQWNVYTPAEVLSGRAELPHRILLVDDTGDRQAFITAEYLLERRHPVHIVSQYPQLGHAFADAHDLPFAFGRLRRAGVTFTPHVEVAEIDGDTVTLTDVFTSEPSTLTDVDAVVLILATPPTIGWPATSRAATSTFISSETHTHRGGSSTRSGRERTPPADSDRPATPMNSHETYRRLEHDRITETPHSHRHRRRIRYRPRHRASTRRRRPCGGLLRPRR